MEEETPEEFTIEKAVSIVSRMKVISQQGTMIGGKETVEGIYGLKNRTTCRVCKQPGHWLKDRKTCRDEMQTIRLESRGISTPHHHNGPHISRKVRFECDRRNSPVDYDRSRSPSPSTNYRGRSYSYAKGTSSLMDIFEPWAGNNGFNPIIDSGAPTNTAGLVNMAMMCDALGIQVDLKPARDTYLHGW